MRYQNRKRPPSSKMATVFVLLMRLDPRTFPLTSEQQLNRELYVSRSAPSQEWIAKPYVRGYGDW